MNKHDETLFKKIIHNKQQYIIEVDNDCVIVSDKHNPEGDYETFNEYGYHLLKDIFNYLGIESDYV